MGNAVRVVVTGSTGFLGRHVMPVMRRRYGAENVIGLSSRDYDLTDPFQVKLMLSDLKPDVVVHLAAYVGGIGANKEHPADFFYRNTMLMALTFDAAARSGVKKLLYTMGGCSYPAAASSPIDERQMWDGYPQAESAAYSAAKKLGLVASEAYRKQYGLNSVVLVPGNMYGEYDNFRPAESHVVPATIRRFFEAKISGATHVVMWGTGAPIRDFVYAGDAASLIPWFVDRYDSSDPVNISTGTRTSIRELACLIKDLVGYEGEVCWDSSKPDGQMVKVFSVERLHALGMACPTALEEGLRRTISWFLKHFKDKSDGIRL